MMVNGIDIHEWAVEQVATELLMSALMVRVALAQGEAVMKVAVHFAELYGSKIAEDAK